jgi:superoxide dismutase
MNKAKDSHKRHKKKLRKEINGKFNSIDNKKAKLSV